MGRHLAQSRHKCVCVWGGAWFCLKHVGTVDFPGEALLSLRSWWESYWDQCCNVCLACISTQSNEGFISYWDQCCFVADRKKQHCLNCAPCHPGIVRRSHFQFILTASLCGNSSQWSRLWGYTQRGLCVLYLVPGGRWTSAAEPSTTVSSPQCDRMTSKGLYGILEKPHANFDTSLAAPDGSGKAATVGSVLFIDTMPWACWLFKGPAENIWNQSLKRTGSQRGNSLNWN